MQCLIHPRMESNLVTYFLRIVPEVPEEKFLKKTFVPQEAWSLQEGGHYIPQGIVLIWRALHPRWYDGRCSPNMTNWQTHALRVCTKPVQVPFSLLTPRLSRQRGARVLGGLGMCVGVTSSAQSRAPPGSSPPPPPVPHCHWPVPLLHLTGIATRQG